MQRPFYSRMVDDHCFRFRDIVKNPENINRINDENAFIQRSGIVYTYLLLNAKQALHISFSRATVSSDNRNRWSWLMTVNPMTAFF